MSIEEKMSEMKAIAIDIYEYLQSEDYNLSKMAPYEKYKKQGLLFEVRGHEDVYEVIIKEM